MNSQEIWKKMVSFKIYQQSILKVLYSENLQGSKISSNDRYSFGDEVLDIFFSFKGAPS